MNVKHRVWIKGITRSTLTDLASKFQPIGILETSVTEDGYLEIEGPAIEVKDRHVEAYLKDEVALIQVGDRQYGIGLQGLSEERQQSLLHVLAGVLSRVHNRAETQTTHKIRRQLQNLIGIVP